MNNCMVRMISGDNSDYGRCCDGMVDLALANIKRSYLFLGFLAYLAKSMVSLTEKMGWKPMEIEKKNINNKNPNYEQANEIGNLKVTHSPLGSSGTLY